MPPTAQPDWKPNNLACTNTSGALNALEEIRAKFSAAGAIAMEDLAYWNKVQSNDLRATEAAGLAGRIDLMFKKLLGAKYETDVTRAIATGAMQATLTQAKQTVAHLAAVVDANYRFRGEQ